MNAGSGSLTQADGAGSRSGSPSVMRPRWWLSREVLIALLVASIFLFDFETSADNVSIAFFYTVPVLLCLFARQNAALLCAAATTVLTLAGMFLQPPADYVAPIFLANRAIAISMQWIAAILVTTQKRATAIAERRMAEQRDTIDRQSRFIDVLSHEIGTPLTTIDGHAFQLGRKPVPPDMAEIRQRSDKVRYAVRHIKEMVERVQLASEVERDTITLKGTPVELGEIALASIAGFRERGADIRHEGGAFSRGLVADSFMLTEIVENLISNAVKYSEPGSPIFVRWYESEGKAILSVADRGRGIPEDELQRVFSPYFRASNSRGVRGIGIGLFVAERFVRSHGGTISIDSTLDAGTTVTISLPLSAETTDGSHGTGLDPVH